MSRPVAPLDADIRRIVDAMASGGAPGAFDGTISEGRERLERNILGNRNESSMPPVAGQHELLAGWGGLEIPIRLYEPMDTRCDAIVVYAHPGGFALGTVEIFAESARNLCNRLGCKVASIEYRLAPEHPYPAAHEDTWAATRWVAANAQSLGGDPARVALAGESAGANLLANAAIRLRDEGVPLLAQLLIVPSVNFARDLTIDATAPMLTARDMAVTQRYLFAGEPVDRRACPPSPLLAASLEGLPPTVIAVAGHDLLHDEGVAYAERLRGDGVPVTLLDFPSLHHTFFGMARVSKGAAHAVEETCAAFAKLLGSQGA